MTNRMNSTLTPQADLDTRFGDAAATPTPWEDALGVMNDAEVFWISTVRPDGRPHVTPLLAVWVEGALYFGTGEHERKRLNIAENPQCILTTGCNQLGSGLDIVVEGKAVRVINEARLRTVASAIEAKYGPDWRYEVDRDVLLGDGGNAAWLFRVEPVVAFGFRKGEPFSQTRWSF